MKQSHRKQSGRCTWGGECTSSGVKGVSKIGALRNGNAGCAQGLRSCVIRVRPSGSTWNIRVASRRVSCKIYPVASSSPEPLRQTVGAPDYAGRLIAVEGLDGSGKSTQIRLVKSWLEQEGYRVFFTEWNSSTLV